MHYRQTEKDANLSTIRLLMRFGMRGAIPLIMNRNQLGIQLTDMNNYVCDCKFTSVNVNVSVNMSSLRFLSVCCCLFTSDIWWSLWMIQRHIYETWSYIFIVGVEIRQIFWEVFYCSQWFRNTLQTLSLFINTIRPLHCRLHPASTWDIRPISNTDSCYCVIVNVTHQTNPLKGRSRGLQNTHWHPKPQM
jgi:hypothetical protein